MRHHQHKSHLPTAVKEASHALVEAILQEEAWRIDNTMDPYEAYAQRVQMKVHENTERFYERFCLGYEALIKELEREEIAKNRPDTMVM